jgi:hypothetical protein
MEPFAISHPHKDPLFLVIEESGVEFGYDFLIPVVPKLEQISDTLHRIQGILLAVVHNLSRGVNIRRMHLEALCLIRSITMRWRDLGRGLLLVAAGSWSLGKFLGLGRGTTRESTDILMMLQATLITMSHFLQEHRP